MTNALLKRSAVFLILAAAACGVVEGGDEDRIRVVATTGMITDAAVRIAQGRVAVHGMMGPGVDPHLFKARESDVRRIYRADLILYNGLHLEAKLADVLEGMSRRTPTVAVTARIDRSRLLTPPEFEGAYDPHIWFDVRLWMQAVEQVRDALMAADTVNAELYRGNAGRYLTELDELDRWIRAEVERVPAERRVLITAHDAFNYFGRAYGFQVRGLQGISTATEAGTADVRALADFIAERRIPAVFVETSVPRRTIEAVQAAVRSRGFDVRIGDALYSDALGTPGSPQDNYLGMVRHNVRTIVESLIDAPAQLAQEHAP